MSGVAAAGESRVETTLERVLSDPLCTVRAVSVSVSAVSVSVSAAVTAVTGAGLAVAASVLGVLVRAEAVHGLALGAAAEASSERASEAAGKAATVAVSYTHLDVYKRQASACTMAGVYFCVCPV